MKTVFTNGCFDLLHAGHIDLLAKARALGDSLIVGINSDSSVRKLKGPGRPLVKQEDRKRILEALHYVDKVLIFEELTPEQLINDIKPDVLVKGGDWKVSEIVGADLVEAMGGEVHSIPLLEGYSTSALIGAMRSSDSGKSGIDAVGGEIKALEEHREVFAKVAGESGPLEECAGILIRALQGGGKILVFGNGGSAADAQHMAAELVGRYEKERSALRAVALTTDSSALTAIANDYSFGRIFSRQIEALADAGDAVVAISTSGNSENVLDAAMTARRLGCSVVALTGAEGKKLAGLSDACFRAPATRTSRIQEVHSWAIHVLCELIEGELCPEGK